MVFEGLTSKWRDGVYAKTDPNKAAALMNSLAAENRLNAETLVEVSRPEDALMHQDFEWNDAIAGEQWRKHQARNYIGGIVYVMPPQKGEDETPVRVFHLSNEGEGSYKPLNVILQSSDSTEYMRKQALKELTSFRHKYDKLLEIIDAVAEVEVLQQKLETEIRKQDAPPARAGKARVRRGA